jgi:iron complex transport system substrate-binding protein
MRATNLPRPNLPRWTAGILIALVVVIAVAGCGDDGSGATNDASAAWTFTDDAGETVSLDTAPERVVMFEDVAASMIDLGVTPDGIHYIDGVDGNRLFDDVDLDGVETVGSECENLNVEALTALQPDLIVYMLWGEETFCLTPEQVELAEDVAPLVQIQAVGESDAIRGRYLELAEALGADLDSAEQVAKRERFEVASERLADAVAARPEISVIAASIAPEWAGVAEPAAYPDLITLRDRYGVRFTGPFDPDAASTDTYWEELSAETIADFRGDVILMDVKNETPLPDQLDAYPLWAALPEVQAEQIVPWWVPGSFSYTRDAEFMEDLAAAIERADDVVDD